MDVLEARTQLHALVAARGDVVISEWVDAAIRTLIDECDRLQAAVSRVEVLAESWRYKGEFGWGSWREGHGPDQEGHVLDHAASEIRQAITLASASGA